jgi:hypothetical protein
MTGERKEERSSTRLMRRVLILARTDRGRRSPKALRLRSPCRASRRKVPASRPCESNRIPFLTLDAHPTVILLGGFTSIPHPEIPVAIRRQSGGGLLMFSKAAARRPCYASLWYRY